MISLTFYMEPCPKAAAKTTFGDGSVHSYNPGKTTLAMSYIKTKALDWCNLNKVTEFPIYEAKLPILCSATFLRTRPKSLPKHVKLPAVMPDLDNYCKLLLDSLKGVIFADDGQITGIMLEKDFVEPGGLARVHVSFWEALPEDMIVARGPKDTSK